MNLLIDENLSPTLVVKLAGRGVFAQHLAHLDRAGITDAEVWKYAFEHDQVVVTMTGRTSSRWRATASCIQG